MNSLAPSLTLAFALGYLAPVYAQLSSETAPMASYTAIMGATTITQGGVTTTGVRKRDRVSDRTLGVPIYISFTGYSSREELQAISQSKQGNIAAVLSRYNHGTIFVKGTSYPINVATSFRQGNNYRVNFISGQPFSIVGEQEGMAKGSALTSITFTVPVTPGGVTTGSMNTYSSGRIMLNGTVQGIGGVSMMTPFTRVTRG